MDHLFKQRLKSKSVENSIINYIAEDFNLTPYKLKKEPTDFTDQLVPPSIVFKIIPLSPTANPKLLLTK